MIQLKQTSQGNICCKSTNGKVNTGSLLLITFSYNRRWQTFSTLKTSLLPGTAYIILFYRRAHILNITLLPW